MIPPKTRWGTILFACSLIIGATAIFFNFSLPNDKYRVLYEHYAAYAGIALGILSFLCGHFSYPRVHNLKVFLCGYLAGTIGLSYFLLFILPLKGLGPVTDNFRNLLYLLLFINTLIVLILPSVTKYRTTQQITFSLFGIEAFFILMFRTMPELLSWMNIFESTSLLNWSCWIGCGWYAIVMTLCILLHKDEFYLGGVFAGTALFWLMGWTAPFFVSQPHSLDISCILGGLLFLNTGIIFHWISKVEHRISYDPLLHIYNRDFCSKIICEQSKINSTPPFGVAMVDIDHFKKINDTYGHQAGDLVLYHIAQAVQHIVNPLGVACRYGGEELAVFFPQKTTKEIVPIMEKIRTEIESMETSHRKKKIKVTVSAGISHRDDMAQSVMDVIHAADKALYKAKEGGRNQVCAGKTKILEKVIKKKD